MGDREIVKACDAADKVVQIRRPCQNKEWCPNCRWQADMWENAMCMWCKRDSPNQACFKYENHNYGCVCTA